MKPLAWVVLSLYIIFPGLNLLAALCGRPSRARTLAAVYTAMSLFNNAAYFVEATATTADRAFSAVQFEFLFGNLSLVAFFYFIYAWCRVKLPAWFHALVGAFTCAAAIVTLTSGSHGLYFTLTDFRACEGPLGLSGCALKYGPFSNVMYACFIAAYIAIAAMMAHAFRRAGNARQRRALLFFAAAGASPLICERLYSFGLVSALDITPIGYFISQCVLLWCIAHDKVFDVLQEAFDVIAKRMDGALLVADDKNKLLYFNDAARARLAPLCEGETPPAPVDGIFKSEAPEGEVCLNGGIYQSRVTVLRDKKAVRGKVALLSDVSGLYQLKDMLEKENRRIADDLVLAASIQRNVLPRVFPPWPERTDFEIYATMRPAREVGGDFYDFFLVDDAHLACVIADVSGKGIPAALFMMNAKACVRDFMMAGMTPEKALTAANNRLCAGNDAGMFVTAWAILINLNTGDACFANAGHNPPLVKRAQGAWEALKSRPNMVLADTPDIAYRINPVKFAQGDRLYLYTDGVVEAQNAAQELYGDARLAEALSRCANGAPRAILNAVQADVDRFVEGAPQFDDITMLCVQLKDTVQTLTVPATLDSCAQVAAFIEEWLAQKHCAAQPARQILVAQDEIFSNIARYAFAGMPGGGKVTLELSVRGRNAVMRFIDGGTPFNPLDSARGRRAYNDAWKEGGDGIHMVKSLMDQLLYEYRNDQNRFTMIKALGDAETGR